MQLNEPQQKPVRELMLPLINVVLLLLIFLMMMGRVTEPEPFRVNPPESDTTENTQQAITLYYSAQGQLQYQHYIGTEMIIAALLSDQDIADEKTQKIIIRADAQGELSELLRLARQLSASLAVDIKLEVKAR